jgi:UDP-N-acetylmuramate--alanine ligase
METTHKHVYLVGAGGVGMLWIADYALKMGWKLSGSDAADSAGVRRLQALGADIHIGTDPSAIPADVTEAVMTAAATPSSPSFPEVEELRRRGVPIVKRSEWIGKLTKGKFTICVAGAHGKTTTTAMLGWILDHAGLDPTVFVGGSLPAWNNETKIGQGKYLVLEADEYDRSFHRFYPQMAILLNIDLDHTDYYTGGIVEIEKSYRRFLRNLPFRKGLVVAYGKDARLRKLCKGFSYRVRWYDEEHLWPGLKLPQPGLHYRLNATAAARIAHEIGVSQKDIVDALATFPGVGRRFEQKGTWNKAVVYDDYAHHPREVTAQLKAMRERFPHEKLTVIFQPHQKARTQALLADFGRAFDEAAPDRLILAPIFFVAGREDGIEISIDDVAAEVRKKPIGFELQVAQTMEELEGLARAASADSDILMTVGAGNLPNYLERWRNE